MNELVLATYIKILQGGFARFNSQESAARLILEAITNQKDANCNCDLSSKKVSNIVNRKDPVPEEIVIASADPKVIEGVYRYFTDVIINELNPNIACDIYEKLFSLIKDDGDISTVKMRALLSQYDNKKYDHFLAETFLYVLGRNNKQNNKSMMRQPKGLLYKSSVLTNAEESDQIYNSFVCFTKADEIFVNGKYIIEGIFSFDSYYDDDGTRIIRAKTTIDGLVVCGDTSLDNWVSRSYVNNATKAKTVPCEAWLEVLEKNEDEIVVHYFAIGDGI